jgi:Arf-GAP/SH3 domain/ANK repeat/PH domain-containing protein
MPGVIAVSDFVREVREDISSPTTSNFVNRIPQCKETVNKLEEVRIIKKCIAGLDMQ